MSKLNELIQQLCPDGVEYKKLGEVCKLSRGRVYSKDYLRDNPGEYPVYSSQTANDGELGRINTYDCEGDYLTWTTDGAYAGTIFHRTGKFSITNVCGLIKVDSPLLTIRFLYYWLSITTKGYVYQGMGNPKLMTNQIEIIPIPLPPLPIQEEIVRLLDQLTETTQKYQAELESELDARKKQYEEYRKHLFAFDEFKLKVKLLKIEDIAKCYAGATPKTERKEYWDNGNIPWMSSGEVNLGQVYHTEKFITQEGYDNSSTKMLPKDTVVIALAGQGKTRGTVAITRIELCTNQSLCGVVLNNNEVNSDYLYHYLKGQYETLRKISSGDGTRGGLNLKMINNFEVPIPDLLEQERIVNILDRMDKAHKELCQSIETEIKMRKQQYEYYRDKLLDFKKKED